MLSGSGSRWARYQALLVGVEADGAEDNPVGCAEDALLLGDDLGDKIIRNNRVRVE
jgi:hypothetical protein